MCGCVVGVLISIVARRQSRSRCSCGLLAFILAWCWWWMDFGGSEVAGSQHADLTVPL